jgi:hypothetical protein
MLRGGQSRARQNAGTTQRRKAVSLYEDTQALIWEASELLGMDNDPTVKAALMLLLKEAAKRGIRRKSNDEMIEEIVSGGAS